MPKINHIPCYAVTGGPSGGKTSILAFLMQALLDHGVQAVIVPEAARMLLANGVTPATIGPEIFQERIVCMQRSLEQQFKESAARLSSDQVVILCDRGLMDNQAYTIPEVFDELMRKLDLNATHARDREYDAVLHLVTAADGAEEFYACDSERQETPAEARALDERIRNAWVGQPHLSIIDNSTDFDGKKRRALETVLHHLGLPVPLESERKFLVDRSALEKVPAHAQTVDIEQVYVRSSEPSTTERVRRRGQDGNWVYYRTRKTRLRTGLNEEREWQITGDEYHAVVNGRGVSIVKKKRICFLHRQQYFELDDFSPMGRELFLLEVELTDEQQELALPSWVLPENEVTDDPSYGNSEIAEPLR